VTDASQAFIDPYPAQSPSESIHSTMRVIFDRSSFHEPRFEQLVTSPLRRLVAERRITIFHTPVFLDEIIQSYGSPRASETWRKHLEFAARICDGGVFLSKEDIWRGELVDGRGPLAQHLLPPVANEEHDSFYGFLGTLLRTAETGDLSIEWSESAVERDEGHKKRNNQHSLFRGARDEVAGALRARRIKGSLKEYPFSEYRRTEFNRNGRSLMRLVDESRCNELGDLWEANPEQYPYYTAFVEGFVYSQYYAAIEHNKPLDRNAQADFEQLAYLTWSDIVVSDDERFFRSAFDAIWKPRGKLLESAAGFAARLQNIVAR
jgi:hypothetical protein